MGTKNQLHRLKAARREFAERHHRWALADAKRETNQDLPFVRKIKNQTVYRFLEMIEPLGREERLRLLTGLVKRSYNVRPGHTPEIITPEEKLLIDRYSEYDHGEIFPGLRVRLPIVRDGKHKHLRVEGERFKLAKINRKALHGAIVEKLRNVCGGTLKSYGAGSSSYFESGVGSWIMRTEFTMGSKFWHFDYSHRLVTRMNIAVGEEISLLRWLGIGQTSWELQDESQVADAVEALGNICAHFLREAPGFLKGFDPPAVTPMGISVA
jgi:hypothetical protein